MKEFRVSVQFFSPDLTPTAIGKFIVEAEDESDAEHTQIDNCVSWGYQIGEFIVMDIQEVEE